MNNHTLINAENAASRGCAEIEADIAIWRQERAEAEAEFERIRAARQAALSIGSIDEVAAFDIPLSRADARQDIAAVKIGRLEAEYSQAVIEGAEAHVRAKHAKAAALADRISVLLHEDYSKAAASIVKTLLEINKVRAEVDHLNSNLPKSMQITTEDRKWPKYIYTFHEDENRMKFLTQRIFNFEDRVCLPDIFGKVDLWAGSTQ